MRREARSDKDKGEHATAGVPQQPLPLTPITLACLLFALVPHPQKKNVTVYWLTPQNVLAE